MKSNRILFIVPSLNIGGMERVLVTVANALSSRGHKVSIIILSPRAELAKELRKEIVITYKPLKKHVGNYLPYIRHRFYDDGMWETRTTPQHLHDYYVGKEHYDVEIGFFRGLPVKIVSGYRFSKHNQQCVHLAWVHSDFSKAKGWNASFHNTKDVFQAYQRMDKVICVSEQAKEGFIASIGDTNNLTTVYNCLPQEEIAKKAKMTPEVFVQKRRFHFVVVGRLNDKVKGQKRVIEAVVKLNKDGYSVSLGLIGGGPDEELLREYIKQQSAEEYITLTGNQSNPYPYIYEADLLICSSYYEGYNLTVAEGLLLGIPVLSTSCTGPNEILDWGKYGFIVENSESGLYNGMKYLLDHPDEVRRLKEQGKKRAACFDEVKTIDEIELLLLNTK